MLRQTFLGFLLCISLQVGLVQKAILSSTNVDVGKIGATKLTDVEERIHRATVKVKVPGGHGTGTYFTYKGYTFVLTAAHVVDEHETALIISDHNTLYGDVVLCDKQNDLAVIKVEDLGIEALRWKPAEKVPGVGTDVYFVSYPSSHDKLSIRGEVAGYWDNGSNFYFLVHGYGWPGSSGAGIFNSRGQIVGTLTAVEVGSLGGRYPYQAIEDIVWMKPITLLDQRLLLAELSRVR